MLSPGKHLATAATIVIVPVFLAMTIYDRLPEEVQKREWVKALTVFGLLLIISAALMLFEEFVPAECPRCGGKMYEDVGVRYGVRKKCRECGHGHLYF